MAVEFGATPWGRAWLRIIEPTTAAAPNPLLPAARSLARARAVAMITETGRLTAQVTQARRQHQVLIELPRWSRRSRAQALRLAATVGTDGLAPGDLPDTLVEDLHRHGIDVAVPIDQQDASCDCRTRRRPCAHVLATLYTLVQRVDERPALAIELRAAHASPQPVDPDWLNLTDIDPARFYTVRADRPAT